MNVKTGAVISHVHPNVLEIRERFTRVVDSDVGKNGRRQPFDREYVRLRGRRPYVVFVAANKLNNFVRSTGVVINLEFGNRLRQNE